MRPWLPRKGLVFAWSHSRMLLNVTECDPWSCKGPDSNLHLSYLVDVSFGTRYLISAYLLPLIMTSCLTLDLK